MRGEIKGARHRGGAPTDEKQKGTGQDGKQEKRWNWNWNWMGWDGR